jgi:hypothetical protein
VEKQLSDIGRLTDNCSMYLALVPNMLIPSSSVNFQSIDGSLRGLRRLANLPFRMGFFAPSIVEHEGASQAQTTDEEIPHHPASKGRLYWQWSIAGASETLALINMWLGTYVVV